ncbi:hypothetical protein AVEN_244056-1 [Araneus ventricosus]|uniref:Uncharacterized protein n=1 Tax=Araneus ventricosus TaxID=182803 RepID=A0A4Y2IHG3_ARAVE|nr:hypothetical protein AVEN_244056-1 [Araneus ventricosus]
MADVWPSKYDLTCTGPHTRWVFSGIGFRAWKSSGSDADSLSLGHRRLLFDSRIQSHRLSSTADETPKSLQSIINTNTQYRSASNSLLARTVDRTPKRDFKDVGTPRRSQSTNTFKVYQHSLTP